MPKKASRIDHAGLMTRVSEELEAGYSLHMATVRAGTKLPNVYHYAKCIPEWKELVDKWKRKPLSIYTAALNATSSSDVDQSSR